MAVTGIAAIFAGNSAEIINWLRGRQTKDLEYERINRNTAADLIERQQKEIEQLRAVKEAYRYHIDASDREISEAGMTRDGALRHARDLDALLDGSER